MVNEKFGVVIRYEDVLRGVLSNHRTSAACNLRLLTSQLVGDSISNIRKYEGKVFDYLQKGKIEKYLIDKYVRMAEIETSDVSGKDEVKTRGTHVYWVNEDKVKDLEKLVGISTF